MAYHRTHKLDTHLVKDIQHIRPEDGSQRRQSRPRIHIRGPARRGLHRIRRRNADEELLLVDDEVEGIMAPDELGLHDPVNIGKPRRIQHAGACEPRPGTDGNPARRFHQAAAQRRPKVRCPDITSRRNP